VVSSTQVELPREVQLGIDLIAVLASDKHSDVALKVEGEDDLRVHRSILAARSPVIQQTFDTEMSEASGVVSIVDMSAKALRNLCGFLCRGTLEDATVL